MKRTYSAFCAFFAACVTAFATTYTPTDQASFADAITNAGDGDEIVIDGTVSIAVAYVYQIDKAVTLRGKTSDATKNVLNMGWVQARFEMNNANAVIKDLTFTGSGIGTANTYGLITINENGGLVTNCRFKDGHGSKSYTLYLKSGQATDCVISGGTRDAGIIMVDGANALFDHNVVTNCGVTPGGTGTQGIIKLVAGTVSDCVIANNKTYGSVSSGVNIQGGGLLRNCTIVKNDNTGSGAGGVYWAQKTDARVVNCVIAGNTTTTGSDANIKRSGTGQDAQLPNVFLNNCVEGLDIGTACLQVATLEDILLDSNYEPTRLSPVIDKGTDTQGLSLKDLAGKSRVLGSAVDIGAYEYNPVDCDFTASTTNILVNTAVTLTAVPYGASGNQAYSWTVTHDQGVMETATSTAAEFVFTPTEVGSYSVTLTMTDGDNIITKEQKAYLRASNYACDFTADATQGLIGKAFHFISQVSGVSEGLTYQWTFVNSTSGAYTTSVEQNPMYVPTTAGKINVTLEVTSELGTVSKTKESYLTVQIGRCYVDPDCATSAFPYDDWSKAASNIADAVAACGDGGEVVLAKKTFPLADTYVLGRGVTLTGDGTRDETTLKITTKGKPVIAVSNECAVLKNVTITGSNVGYLEKGGLKLVSGLVTNVVISGNIASGTYAGPSAAVVSGGRLTGSLITSNTGGHAAALAVSISGNLNDLQAGKGPEVDHCEIVDNEASSSGSSCNGAVSIDLGLLHDCLIARNTCSIGQTAGVAVNSYGTVYNCTIADNDSGAALAGGIYWDNQGLARIVNCVIVGNKGTKCDWAKASEAKDADLPNVFLNCLFDGSDIGGTNCRVASAGDTCQSIAGHDYSLVSGSVARDAGLGTWKAINNKVTVTVGGVDLAGNPRIMNEIVDLGAYEYDPNQLSCDIKAVSATEQFVGSTFSLEAVVPEVSGTLAYAWKLTCGETVLTSTNAAPSFTLNEIGRYDVDLTVTLGTTSVSSKKTDYLLASPRTQTVSEGGTTLAQALDLAIAGGVIRVSGAYTVSETVLVNKGVTIEGETGRDTDKVVANGARPIFNLNHKDAVLRGLMVTGCDDGEQNKTGGGVYIGVNGGTVEDCLVADNKLGYYGAGAGIYTEDGATNAIIRRTVIRGNHGHAAAPGIGVSLGAGVLESSLVVGNYGTGKPNCSGVAVRTAKAKVRNCTIVEHSGDGDSATKSGIFVVSTALDGGSPEIVNTVVAGNTNDGVAVSWLVGKNTSNQDFLCDYNTNNFVAAFSHCATDSTTNLLEGMDVAVTNFAAMGFVTKGPYGLRIKGPYCIKADTFLRDKGVWQDWMTGATDLYGLPRVDKDNLVDIGACEAKRLNGSIFIVR